MDLVRREPDLLAWLASLAPGRRDAAVEEWLGISEVVPTTPPGDHLVGYHASGVAPIVRALAEVPVGPSDRLVDLGSGLGKVVLLTAHPHGAQMRAARGAAARARRAGACLGEAARRRRGVHPRRRARRRPPRRHRLLPVRALHDGPALDAVLARLHDVASRRAIVVCALGIDFHRAPWLAQRPLDAFWLSIDDSRVPGVAPRSDAVSPMSSPHADVVAFEGPLLAATGESSG